MSWKCNKCDIYINENVGNIPIENLLNTIFEEYIQEIYFSKKDYCTGMHGKEVCKIESINKMNQPYLKMPKLKDLYKELFGYFPDETKLHNAFIDVIVCFRCFYKMCFLQDICNDPNIPTFLLNLYNDISPLKNKIYRINDIHIKEEKVPRKSQRLLLKRNVCYVDKKTRRKK